MYLLFVKPEIRTASGLVARPVLTSYYKSRHFRERPDSPYTRYTSPNEAILCPDSAQSMYAQLLCGLARRGEVLRVGAVFASAFLRSVKFLEAHWRALCDDIRAGRIDAVRVTDPACRDAVARVVARPDLARGDAIASESEPAVSSRFIVRRLWPRTKNIDVMRVHLSCPYTFLLSVRRSTCLDQRGPRLSMDALRLELGGEHLRGAGPRRLRAARALCPGLD